MVVYVCLFAWFLLFLFLSIRREDHQAKLFKFQPMVSSVNVFPFVRIQLYQEALSVVGDFEDSACAGTLHGS